MNEDPPNKASLQLPSQASDREQIVPVSEAKNSATGSSNEDSSAPGQAGKSLSAKPRRRAKALERQIFRALCRMLLVSIDKDESEQGACVPHPSTPPLPDFSRATSDCQVLLAQSIRYFEAAEKRHEAIKDKGKTILALMVFVASFITLSASFFGHGVLLLVPTIFAFATVWFFLEMFRLSWSGVPKMDQALVEADDTKQRLKLAEEYVRAARFGDRRTDYIASVLTAARRAVALALVSVVTVTVGYSLSPKDDQLDDLVKRLQSDATLLYLLRGPKGDQGPKGDKGDKGAEGPRGDPGSSFGSWSPFGPWSFGSGAGSTKP